MREEAEGFVAHQAVDGDLLDPEDDGAVGQVLLDDGAGAGVGLHGVGPSIGGLDYDLHALSDKFADVLRGERSPTFPY